MADDDQDESEKTEEPTHRRLEEALKKGQVVNSKEVNNFLMLFAFGLLLLWLAPTLMHGVYTKFSLFLQSPHEIDVSEENFSNIFSYVIGSYASIMLPIIVTAVAAALIANIFQHPLVFSADSMIPKLSKISPIKGLKKMFSLRSLTEFIKGILKISLVGMVAYMVLWPMKEELDFLITFDMLAALDVLHSTALRIMVGVLSFMAIIAIADFLYQRYEHIKNLKMSRHEIKQEIKQTEGDPQIKARLKQIRMERARKRMMAAIPEADIVITNPTHFAVALKYDHIKMAAPIVVAKGMNDIALKIKEIAEEHDIPLVENPPLARALYDAVDLDEEIPIEFYQTVAEIIGYVYRLKNKKAA